MSRASTESSRTTKGTPATLHKSRIVSDTYPPNSSLLSVESPGPDESNRARPMILIAIELVSDPQQLIIYEAGSEQFWT